MMLENSKFFLNFYFLNCLVLQIRAPHQAVIKVCDSLDAIPSREQCIENWTVY
jgi:hypothetical protein